MIIKHQGCEIECNIDASWSAVDAFIESAWNITLGRELSDAELDNLQDMFAGAIQIYAYRQQIEAGNLNYKKR